MKGRTWDNGRGATWTAAKAAHIVAATAAMCAREPAAATAATLVRRFSRAARNLLAESRDAAKSWPSRDFVVTLPRAARRLDGTPSSPVAWLGLGLGLG